MYLIAYFIFYGSSAGGTCYIFRFGSVHFTIKGSWAYCFDLRHGDRLAGYYSILQVGSDNNECCSVWSSVKGRLVLCLMKGWWD